MIDFDFEFFLVLAVIFSGLLWGIDSLFFAPKRRQQQEQGVAAREPVLVEYARSFFPVLLVVLLLRSFLYEPFRIPSRDGIPLPKTSRWTSSSVSSACPGITSSTTTGA